MICVWSRPAELCGEPLPLNFAGRTKGRFLLGITTLQVVRVQHLDISTIKTSSMSFASIVHQANGNITFSIHSSISLAGPTHARYAIRANYRTRALRSTLTATLDRVARSPPLLSRDRHVGAARPHLGRLLRACDGAVGGKQNNDPASQRSDSQTAHRQNKASRAARQPASYPAIQLSSQRGQLRV